ncbi:MAG: hypothetical protein Q9190_001112 [Brigantiaea leucoxantha]
MTVRVSLQPISVADVDKSPNASFGSTKAGADSVLVSVESGSVHKHCPASGDLLETIASQSLRDFQWYFEQYIIKEPFAHARAFFWKILEDTSFWGDFFHWKPRQVTVVRVYENQNSAPIVRDSMHTALPSCTEPTIVLAITARPSRTKDIPHRLITRSISAAVDMIRHNSDSQATSEIVRPGTFEALECHIRRHPYGYFGVVHLDLHGDSDGQW